MSGTPTCNGIEPSIPNTPLLLQVVLGVQGRRTALPYAPLGGRTVRQRSSNVLAILDAAIALVDSTEEDELTVQRAPSEEQ
jgi:hypothetical protein